MDKNENNEQAERENSDRSEEQQDRDRGQDDGPEIQEHIDNIITEINALTTILQDCFTDTALESNEIKERMEEFKAMPDNEAMSLLGENVNAFMKSIPFANQINVNLFITVIATIAGICKIEKVTDSINRMNEKILKDE